jgi:hypothetical protein
MGPYNDAGQGQLNHLGEARRRRMDLPRQALRVLCSPVPVDYEASLFKTNQLGTSTEKDAKDKPTH